LLDSIASASDTTYTHRNLVRINGCYKVAAIDSVYNETLSPMVVCIDTCRQYVLPSVFTPNGDGRNDLYHPCDTTTDLGLQVKNCPPYKNVKRIDMKIYNRWGTLVYETTDIDVNWDGKYKGTDKECPAGVYYYVCRVYFFSVNGEQEKKIHGTVELIR
jgi:gliding motility-associated-like protein